MYYKQKEILCPNCNEVLNPKRLCSCCNYKNVDNTIVYYAIKNGKPRFYFVDKEEYEKYWKYFRKYKIEIVSTQSWEDFTKSTFENFFYRQSVIKLSTRMWQVMTFELKKIGEGIKSLFRFLNVGYSETKRNFLIKNYSRYWSNEPYKYPNQNLSEEYYYFTNLHYKIYDFGSCYSVEKPISKLTFTQQFICVLLEIIYLIGIFLLLGVIVYFLFHPIINGS